MENSAYISKLIQELSQGSDDLVRKELEGLEYANPSLLEDRREVESIWTQTESYKSNVQFDHQAAFSKFKAAHIENEIPIITKQPKVIFLRRRFILGAVAASLAILVSGWFTFFSGETIHNNTSDVQKHLLADGSIMHLMPGSKVALASNFGSAERAVDLKSGIALFNVEKSTIPFEVELGNSSIEVTGTLFSVKKDKNITINLFEGSINYASYDKTTKCTAGYSLFHDSKHGVVKSEGVDESIFDFIDNKLSFDKTPLDEVIVRLETFYDVTISSEVAIPHDLHFTSTMLDQASLESILETLEVSFDAKIQKESDTQYSIISLTQDK